MARTYAEIQALKPTTPEQDLIAACKEGQFCTLGDGTRPDGPDPARLIRAEILRYLILGGCDDCRVHEWGVQLVGAYVEGALDLSFATAKGATTMARCRFTQPIVAMQTRVEMLALNDSLFPGLNAQGMNGAGPIVLRGVAVYGEVSLAGARIGGQLDCTGARFSNATGDALNAQGVEVTADAFLTDVKADGAVSLAGARIGGQLECTGARFSNAKGKALNAQGVEVTVGVFLQDVEANGEVSLSGARIGGQLGCTGARFTNATGMALNAQGVDVTADAFLDGVQAIGEVSLSGARIGGQLSCTGARFSNAAGMALNAQGVNVTADVFLRDVGADGEVSLYGARIGGQLSCTGARLINANGDALNARRLRVTEGLFWRQVTVTEGSVDLASAWIGDLVDDLSSWPEAGRLILDGFTYDRISGAFTDTRERLDWLSRGTVWKGEFFPQPYTHLAKVYREMGHDRAARDVLAKRRRIAARHEWARAHAALNGDWNPAFRSLWADFGRLGDWTLRNVVGYGYKPFRSLGWLVLLWLITVWLAVSSWHEGSMVPASAVVLTSPDWRAIEADRHAAAFWSATRGPGQDYETFSAAGWAADLVVPILDLGQTAAWAPSTARGPVGAVLWWARWLLQAAGWLVMGLFAAAVTGIIRREED